MKPKVIIETRDLSGDLWPAYEKLFGQNGACGGCWCMAWRAKDGERWEDLKGAQAKRRMKAMVLRGEAHGVLAFVDEEPVGWCSYGPRLDYPKLGRARSLACDDAERVWSLPCFFIKRGWRGKGVATALLGAALEQLRLRGAEVVEGYPVKPASDGAPLPAAFAWTGTRGLFEAFGFEVVGNPDGAKQRVRLVLSP
jgi:GNAT superfamily N-acetyltransferase